MEDVHRFVCGESRGEHRLSSGGFLQVTSGEVLSFPDSSAQQQQEPARLQQASKSDGSPSVSAEPSAMLEKQQHQQALKELTLKIATINDRENKLLSKDGLGGCGQCLGDQTR